MFRKIMLHKVGDVDGIVMCQKKFLLPLLLYYSHYGGIVLHYSCGKIFLIKMNINGESKTRMSHTKMKVIVVSKRSCMVVVLLIMYF
jgi:hypothetical protein